MAKPALDEHYAMTSGGRTLHIVHGYLQWDTSIIGAVARCGRRMARLVHPSDHEDGGRVCRQCEAVR